MSPEDFDAAFDSFRESAFRLETLQVYLDDSEAEDLALFLAGKPVPELTPQNDPWLRRVAETTAAGKRWSRVHIVEHPLSDYIRFELFCYKDNVAAGEEVRIAGRDRFSGVYVTRDLEPFQPFERDFWLFDADTPEPFALLLDYDPSGRLLWDRIERTSDPHLIEQCRRERDFAVAHSIPLHEYMVTSEA